MSFSAVSNRQRLAKRRSKKLAVALAGASLLLAALSPGVDVASAGGRYHKTSRTIRRGLVLMSVVDSNGPNRIKVLKIDPSSDMTIDVALANNVLPGRETTSSMARRHGAIAAVNGNFGTSWGRPLGLLAEDGVLHTSPIASGGAFAVSQDERQAFVGYPDLTMEARNLTGGKKWSVASWNDPSPRSSAISGYTRAGGESVRPPQDSCSVRLVPKTKLAWNPLRVGVSRTYRVDKKMCSSERLAVNGGVVLAARRGSRAASSLGTARAGQLVRVGWSLGWAGVTEAIGGSPVLMRDGRVSIGSCSGYVCQRHPRTGVGVMPNGSILLVTVDGRQSNSVGMNIIEFARLFKWLGAESAMNLDGGGSATMVVNGSVVNSPSDSNGERAVVSALMVLPGPDAREPRLLAP
jgi:Phosphodiester glycosidase